MKLPERFIIQMQDYFLANPKMDSRAFFNAFDQPAYRGLRINRLKVDEVRDNEILNLINMNKDQVPWCSSGYYIHENVSGNHPLFHAGLFYIQEPSAMLPAEMLNAKPGEMVLDLCAAPGGKATRIAEQLQGQGILVANEISRSRSRALLYNIERMGIKNALIYNETPENLVRIFGAFFDKILIDAPCSGEGMFRRDSSAKASWIKYGPASTSKLQSEIIHCADQLLKPGGKIVYSTCTFSEEENEQVISSFMTDHPYYELIEQPDLENKINSVLIFDQKSGYRIWPHIHMGEGHFCVLLQKMNHVSSTSLSGSLSVFRNKKIGKKEKVSIKEFIEAIFKPGRCEPSICDYDSMFNQNGHIKIISNVMQSYLTKNCIKDGFYLGEIKTTTNRCLFIPSHALALASMIDEIKIEHVVKLSYSDDRVIKYLKGETIQLDRDESSRYVSADFVIIALESYPLGWGKIQNGFVKNLYPKSWRIK